MTLAHASVTMNAMKKYHLDNFYIDSPKIYGNVSLYQIGALHCNTDTVIDTHRQGHYFELTVVTDGKGNISADGKSAAVKKNDIFVSYPFETHKIEPDPDDPIFFHYLAFSVSDPETGGMLQRIAHENPSAAERILQSEPLSAALAAAINEFSSDMVLSREYRTALLTEITVLLIRGFSARNTHYRKPDKNEEFVYQIMNHINTHIFSMRSLFELCDAFGYEYSRISKIFSLTTGKTLESYFRARRFQTALSLLNENLKVGEIANMLNYSSVYSFSKAFKQYFGFSPTLRKSPDALS